MVSQELLNRVRTADELIEKNGDTEEYAYALIQYGEYIIEVEKDREYGLETLKKAKDSIERIITNLTGGTVWQLDYYCHENKVQYEILNKYYDILKIEARNKVFDSYMLYLEKNREPSQRFYLPKRKQFLKIGIIQAYQKALNRELHTLCISMPPGTGKTTIEKFFNSGLLGWYPDDSNLFFSHSAGITRMYYDGVLSIVSDNIEYTWNEIFPDARITSTNAKAEQININKYSPFPNLQTSSVGSEMAGKVRCSKNGFLLVDDMIGKIDEALNKSILDKLWNIYATDARQRMVTGTIQIITATRWSTIDPIGRLKAMFEDDPEALFLSVSDIDPETGESNFDYEFNGLTKEFFESQQLLMDEITYRCLYKNEPIEREGLLYNSDELRRYMELPSREPDAVLGICDTKSKGTDYMFLPVFYQYDNDYYLVDCICDNSSDFGMQYTSIANIIVRHNMQQVEFESNAGGDRIAFEVDKRIKDLGGSCNITTKATETNKETRIIVNSDWIKRNVLFKDKELYTNKDQYGVMMSFLLSYSIAGRNKHDDVCDGLANFSLFVQRKYRIHRTAIFSSPF